MTYGYKFPYEDFLSTRKRFRSLEKAKNFIEMMYAPGCTTQPYVQLVEITEKEYRIVAEWLPHRKCWLSPLKAAGFQ